MAKQTKVTESRVDELLKQLETVSNDALKSALQKQLEFEQKKEENLILSRFEVLSKHLNNHVEQLREIRKMEREARSNVEIFDKVFEQFKKDGNWKQAKESLNKQGFYLYD